MPKHIHFIGICGVAMSALGIAFKKAGWIVTGSDVGFFPPVSDHLKKNHIDFYPGWHPEKMLKNGRPDIVVVGNVAGSTNPELFSARENNLNYKSYPEVVAESIVQEHSLVCSGTYGKTTSAALLTWILMECGMNPTYMFGGLSLNISESARIRPDKNRSGWSVLEGDEYKTARWDVRPKFKLYSPTHLLLTAVSWDHADVFPTERSYLNAFRDLIKMVHKKGLIVACADGENVGKLIPEADCRIATYGKLNADYLYRNVAQTREGISFGIVHEGRECMLTSRVLGEHMAENICGCFAMASEIGLGEGEIIRAIAGFGGVKRRLEKRADGDIAVYDDLAHSPAKAKATLATLRRIYPESKIVAVFEPNTGNRRPQSAAGYANAFADADEVVIPTLTKVKVNPSDAESPLEGRQIAEVISRTHGGSLFIGDDEKLIEHIVQNTKKDDVVVFLGSHGFRGMIERLAGRV